METREPSYTVTGNVNWCSNYGEEYRGSLKNYKGFPHSSVGKQSACNAETWVRFLGREDPLEKEMATHSSVLAWRIPGTGSLVGCRLWGRTESDTTKAMQ